MRNRRLLFAGLTAAFALLLAVPTLADDHDLPPSHTVDTEATLAAAESSGRTITSVSGGVAGTTLPGGLLSSLPVVGEYVPNTVTFSGDTTMTASLGVIIDEYMAQGVPNGWSVRVTATDLVHDEAEEFEISNAAITAEQAVATSALGLLTGVTIDPGSAETLDGPQTIYTVNGQLATVPVLGTPARYTNTYVSVQDLTLEVPNGLPDGTYKGELTVTIIE